LRLLSPSTSAVSRGSLVAYSANGDIYTVDVITGARSAIVSGPDNDYGPRWSRDGTRIAFLRADETGGSARLFVVRADGQGLQALTPEPFLTLGPTDRDVYEFSPDGKRIMFVSKVRGVQLISVVGMDGVLRNLDVGMSVRSAAWRPPNGDEILFISQGGCCRGLYVARADGSDVRVIVGPPGTSNVHEALWSPDGTRIAYTRSGGLNSDDGFPVRLRVVSADGDNDHGIGMGSGHQWEWEIAPAWSNDGTRLVLVRIRSLVTLVVVSADGAGPRIEAYVGAVPPCYDDPGSHEWAPDDTSIMWRVGCISGEPIPPMFVDPQTGATRPASWAASSDPSWQRLAP